MLIDLLNTDNYVSYNVKIAESLGLTTAVYLTELININHKAYLKEKLDPEGFFTVDRKYVLKRTTLDSTVQCELDKALVKLNVLQVSNNSKNSIKLDLEALASLITQVDVKKLAEISKKVLPQKDKKKSQREAIIDNLKSNIVETNEELRSAYFEWIDAVYSKQNWMSKKAVVEGQQLINSYSNHDLDLALKILDIAIMGAYRDIHWAISSFERDYKKEFFRNSPVSLNTSRNAEIVKKPEVTAEVF